VGISNCHRPVIIVVVAQKSSEMLPLVDQEVSQKISSDDFSLKINKDKTEPVDIRDKGLNFI
jgi:hypothetical protein